MQFKFKKKDKVLVLKHTDKDRKAYNNYQYPDVGGGDTISFDNKPECNDKGFYGWAYGIGIGDGKDVDSQGKWALLEVEAKKGIVQIGLKVKFASYKLG